MTSSEFDNVTGKFKEAAGDLTGDDSLKTEGKVDQAGASVKEFGEKVQEKLSDAVDAVRNKLDHK